MMTQNGAPGQAGGWYNSPGTAQARGGCGMRWNASEMVAMVGGFALFWPVGLAVLGFKLWQRRSGYPGTLQTFVQEKVGWARNARDGWRGFRGSFGGSTSGGGSFGGGFGFGPRPTGNFAFDEWRTNELKRLEEERRKLEQAEQEFAEHIDELRRARDREEFERFMSSRRNRPASDGQTTSA